MVTIRTADVQLMHAQITKYKYNRKCDKHTDGLTNPWTITIMITVIPIYRH